MTEGKKTGTRASKGAAAGDVSGGVTPGACTNEHAAAGDVSLAQGEQAAAAAQHLAKRAAQSLYDRDRASQMLGIKLIDVKPGYARVAMQVRPNMVNGHHVCHGGLIFMLADSAFAFSCNSYNENTVAAAASIDFLAPAHEGDELSAVANELWRTRRSGLYEVTVTNQRGERIALFRGRSHRISGEVTTAE
jgi:acyl-CoA thioesterase